MTFEIRSDARHVRIYRIRIYLIAAGAISITFVPAVLASASGNADSMWGLLRLVGEGVVVLAFWLALITLLGFVIGRDARHVARALRQADPSIRVEFIRLPPASRIAVLALRPGGFDVWGWGSNGPERTGGEMEVKSVVLTSRKIGGVQLYALEVLGTEGSIVLAVGTRSTWGLSGASRRAHLRLAEQLLMAAKGGVIAS